jgi:ComF family protein
MNLLSGLLDLAYPPFCGICESKLSEERERDLSLCSGCLDRLKSNPPPYCKGCGRSLRGAVETVDSCWECCGRRFHYERSWSCFLYEGLAKEALHLLKYSKRLYFSNMFCRLPVRFVRANPEITAGMDAAVAVPLHGTKLREREFNQAHLLAEAVAAEFGLRDLSGCLVRTAHTRPQSELDRSHRFENVRGTFSAKDPSLLRGKNILLVDDLFTTGATLNECARILKEAGAAKIHCLTFARGA